MGAGRSRSALRQFRKKVISPDLEKDLDLAGADNPAIRFQSIFKSEDKAKQPPPAQFLPPEAMSSGLVPDDDDMDLLSASAWDVATRYHEFKARPSMKQHVRKLRHLSARAILDRAQEVLGSIVHPVEERAAPWSELPSGAAQPEFDIEETLENSPLAILTNAAISTDDIWMDYNVHRKQPVILTIDTSLSMTGEKLALTAVALAVVLLQFPDDPVGIVAFENEAKIIKRPDESLSIQGLIERFLDVPAQGYTHLEDGMKAALNLSRAAAAAGYSLGSRIPSTVLLTDGKYTAGRDPAYLAPRFPHLVVLKMGRERAPLELCRELARKGKGALREVGELEELPSVMYRVVKDLLRGRSLA